MISIKKTILFVIAYTISAFAINPGATRTGGEKNNMNIRKQSLLR
jgi:hypothetical protein